MVNEVRLVHQRSDVTVITVVFNNVTGISRTIKSVVDQTCDSVEYIVIDGKSFDGTTQKIDEFSDLIDIYISEPDRGIYDAMNKAIGLAKGKFLLFMNSGDVFFDRSSLSKLIEKAKTTRSSVVFGGWIRQSRDGSMDVRYPQVQSGIFNHQAVLYARNLHHEFGPYALVPGLTTADYLFLSTLLLDRRIVSCELAEPVAIINIDGVSAGNHTFAQKSAIDYLHGRISRWRLAFYLMLHPVYRIMKKLIGRT